MPIEIFVFAALVALAINPLVTWLEKHRVPRVVAVLALLVLILAVIGLLAYLFLPSLVRQAADFTDHIPGYLRVVQARLQEITRHRESLQRWIGTIDISAEVGSRLKDVLAKGYSFVRNVVSGLVIVVLMFITTIYILINPGPLIAGLRGLVPEMWAEPARRIGAMIAERIRAWVRGTIILGISVGTVIGVGLALLGVPYAVLFGVLAGALEAIPTVGPVLSAIPPVLVMLAADPVQALWVIVLFVGVQQIENNLLVPYIMSRQLQLHPVSVIFGLVAMGDLFGLLGAIVAVPTVAVIKVLYDEVYYPWAHASAALQDVPAEPEPPPRGNGGQSQAPPE